MNALECAVLLSAVACILAFLQIFLMRRSGRQYRITEVLPYQGYSYVYGFGPYQTKESDIQAYDAWADAVLRDEYPKEAYEDNEFAGETYQDWIANAHFLELERWAGVTAMYPLKFLSPRELGILKVRCVSSEGIYVFRVFENIWKSLVLATLLYVLPPLAVPIAGLSLGWILFGGPIASVFASGFVRIHGLPYRLEEVLRAESKYRVLTTLSLTLPLLSASVVVGLQLGMTPLQCIDFGVRLLLALTFSSLLFLYAIVFEKGSNTLLRWQGLVLYLVTIPPVALAVGGGVLLIAETGWFAYSGVCAAAIGVKLLYHSALDLYYRGDMDFVLQETAK
jgi:hypothetical protein